jgi:hypothetical protein
LPGLAAKSVAQPALRAPRDVPAVGRDEPDLPEFHPEALGRYAVRLEGQLEALRGVGIEGLLEVVAQAGVLYLGLADLLDRVSQRRTPRPRLAQPGKTFVHLRVGAFPSCRRESRQLYRKALCPCPRRVSSRRRPDGPELLVNSRDPVGQPELEELPKPGLSGRGVSEDALEVGI